MTSSSFAVDLMENWQSEYLQFTLFILATVWLVQQGSTESKPLGKEGGESDEDQKVGDHAQADSPAWAKAGGLRTVVYSNSLLLLMTAIWSCSWLAQLVTGRVDYNAEQFDHHAGGALAVAVRGLVGLLEPDAAELAVGVPGRRLHDRLLDLAAPARLVPVQAGRRAARQHRRRGLGPPAQHREEAERRPHPALDPQAGRFRTPRQRAGTDHVRIAEELADHDPAGRPHDAGQLAQRGVLVGDLPEDRDEEGGVEAVVLVGERPGVPLARHDVRDPGPLGCAHRVVEHLLLDVEDVQDPAGLQPAGDREACSSRSRGRSRGPSRRVAGAALRRRRARVMKGCGASTQKRCPYGQADGWVRHQIAAPATTPRPTAAALAVARMPQAAARARSMTRSAARTVCGHSCEPAAACSSRTAASSPMAGR